MSSKLEKNIVGFETRFGPCAIRWSTKGIDRVQLSADSPEQTIALLGEGRVCKNPPKELRSVVRRIQQHFAGKSDSLTDVKLDHSGVSDFARSVYKALRKVAPGKVVTYAELAKKVNRPNASRAIGRAMGANPTPILVPCHRVVSHDRGLGGFSAPQGSTYKAKMLFAEGVILDPEHEKGIAHLRKNDKAIAKLIDRVGPYLAGIGQRRAPYDAIAHAILFQQLSGKAAMSISKKFREMYADGAENYPKPEVMLALSPEQFRAAGVSAQKCGYLKDLAEKVTAGQVKLGRLSRLSDPNVIETLTRVKGVGVWSAQMILIFNLGRLDVLPTDDLGLQNGIQAAFNLTKRPTKAEVETFGKRWVPYRSMATWYLWAGLNTGVY